MASSKLENTAIYAYYRSRCRLVSTLFSNAAFAIERNPNSGAHSLSILSIFASQLTPSARLLLF